MKINIYTSFNGVGLERDYNILKGIFEQAGHKVDFADWNNHKNFNPYRPSKADIAFHLEIPRFELMGLAEKNIMIPNPEWFYSNWIKDLKRFDQIFAKTHDCERIFKELHPNVIYTSFTSLDKFNPVIKKEKVFLHVAGQSLLKGTGELIEAYSRYDLPVCYMTSQTTFKGNGNLISTDYLKECADPKESDFDILLNACLIHICPSHYEGFGHYIFEAMSTGAAVITTNAPPMNEYGFSSDYYVDCSPKGKHQIADTYYPHPAEIANTIRSLNDASLYALAAEGSENRKRFLENDKQFKKKILSLL